MPHAFDEFHALISRLPTPIADGDPVVRYLCALVSELAYYHVPKFEIDEKKRANVVPCSGYTEIVRKGDPTDVVQYLQGMDFSNVFVVVDRGIVAVGITIKNLLFIGFRGTVFLYDWKINLSASMVEVHAVSWLAARATRLYGVMSGYRVHRGFGEEAVRVAARIVDEMRERKIDQVDHVFLAGHSLGGAVAALTENFIGPASSSTITLGTPRYCDVAGYFCSAVGPPTHVRRRGDIVPLVPPRSWGYADHPYQFDTSGNLMWEPIRSSGWAHFAWCVCLFLCKGLEPHRMESYRREMGRTACAQLSDEPLIPHERLKAAHVGS